jgi:hypothetical protein
MVNKLEFHNNSVYLCEFCGYGYRSIETAERCEQHCDTQMHSSPRIRQMAIYQPRVEIIPTSGAPAIQMTHSGHTLQHQRKTG